MSFLPYLEQCYVEVFKLMNYPQEDVRKAAIDCLLQFCINFSKIETIEGKQGENIANIDFFNVIVYRNQRMCLDGFLRHYTLHNVL